MQYYVFKNRLPEEPLRLDRHPRIRKQRWRKPHVSSDSFKNGVFFDYRFFFERVIPNR